MSAAVRRSFASLEIRNYRLYFGGQVVSLAGNWMQIVAELWLVLLLTGSGFAVGLATALQFSGILLFGAIGGALADRFDKRKLLIDLPDRDGGPGDRPVRPHRPRRRRGLDGVRGDRAARTRPRRRQPGAAGVRDRDRRTRPGRQRGQPQLGAGPLGAHRRPGDRRRDHRPLGRRALFRPERAQLRGDARRAREDGPGAAPAPAPRPPARQRPRGAPPHRRAAGASRAAAADARPQHGRLQLPGRHPAARRQGPSTARSPPTRC